MATGRPCSKRIGDVLGRDLDGRVPELHAHDRLDGLQRDVEVLQGLRLVGGAPDVGVGGVGLLLAVAVGQVALGEPLAHLRAAAELVDEVGVQPRLVDAQRRVGEQAVAVEPLDVVALERRAVAPDVDAVLVHGADQHGAGDRAAERRGVEVRAAAGADVEGAARHGGQALLDQLGAAVDGAGDLGAVLQGAVGDAVDVGLVVLADVGGVGARDGALGAHPGDRDGGVETSGEGDADALADGQGGENLAHGVGSFWSEWCRRRGPGSGRRGRRRRPGSRPMTSTVSSPAMVPRTSGNSVLSNAEARNWAAPGGVRSTTRLALASALTSSSPQQPGQPVGGGGALPRRRGSSVAALAGYGVHQGAGGAADLDGVELDEVARERGLGDVQAAARRAGRPARPASAPPGCETSSMMQLVPGVLGVRADRGVGSSAAPRAGR